MTANSNHETVDRDWRVWQHSAVAQRYTEERSAALPEARIQDEVMLRLVPYSIEKPISVVDLGCGGGRLLELMLGAYPDATGTGVDGSPAMLEVARQRLARYQKRVQYIEADLTRPDWPPILPNQPCDLVVSGYAVHHVDDAAKRRIYEAVFDILKPGGIFIHAEHVASLSSRGEELFERAYATRLAAFRQEKGRSSDIEAVYDELSRRPDKAANRLIPLERQMQWLREIGFVDVDCYWKFFELAIFAGSRPNE